MLAMECDLGLALREHGKNSASGSGLFQDHAIMSSSGYPIDWMANQTSGRIEANRLWRIEK